MNSDWSNAPVSDRQDAIRKIVIKHSRFNQAFDSIRRFHKPVDGGHHDTGSLAVLIGDSRVGKTFASKLYVKTHPQAVGPEGVLTPVVRVDVPAEGGAAAFLFAIADALGTPVTQRMSNLAVFQAIKRALVRAKTELLIIDEAEVLSKPENPRLTIYVKDMFRKLLDLGTLNILVVGLEYTYASFAVDPRLVGRGLLPYTRLTPYDWITKEDKDEFRRLCRAFDELLPFNERSGLSDIDFASRLHNVSLGNIGRLHNAIYYASCVALNEAAPSVDLKHFAQAYEIRKPPGQTFNPFVHDLRDAPKPKKPIQSGNGKAQSKSSAFNKLVGVRDEFAHA